MITRETTPLPPRIFRKSGTPLTFSDTVSTILDPVNQQFITQGQKPCNRLKRWYEPTTGKWHSNDPIGISGGLNQYVFCGDNPVNFVDPAGFDTTYAITINKGTGKFAVAFTLNTKAYYESDIVARMAIDYHERIHRQPSQAHIFGFIGYNARELEAWTGTQEYLTGLQANLSLLYQTLLVRRDVLKEQLQAASSEECKNKIRAEMQALGTRLLSLANNLTSASEWLSICQDRIRKYSGKAADLP